MCSRDPVSLRSALLFSSIFAAGKDYDFSRSSKRASGDEDAPFEDAHHSLRVGAFCATKTNVTYNRGIALQQMKDTKRKKKGRAYIASISSSKFHPCSELIGTALGIRYRRSSSSMLMLSILFST